MRVLFVADIVGPEAVGWVIGRLPGLRRDLGLDLVIANAENCTLSGPSPDRGFGMRADLVADLFAGGVDVITSGNHAWDSPDFATVLNQPRVLRPHNLPARPDRPGTGVTTVTVGDEAVTVVNLADAGAIADALPPYPAWREIAQVMGDERGTVIVDFHGDSAFAKHGFAHAADGEVAAVLGTHTHEPTSILHMLPGGTALVVDVGMTGRSGGFQGIVPACFLPEFNGDGSAEPPALALASGPLVLGAVLLTIENGYTTAIERVE
jgi:hypothetical protein